MRTVQKFLKRDLNKTAIPFLLSEMDRPCGCHSWKGLGAEVADPPKSWSKSELHAKPAPQPGASPAASLQPPPPAHLVQERLPHTTAPRLKPTPGWGALGCLAARPPGVMLLSRGGRHGSARRLSLCTAAHGRRVSDALDLSSSRTRREGQGREERHSRPRLAPTA